MPLNDSSLHLHPDPPFPPFVDLHRGATLNCQPTKTRLTTCPHHSHPPNNSSRLLSPSLATSTTTDGAPCTSRTKPSCAPAETREAAAQPHEPPPLPYYYLDSTSPDYALFSHTVPLIYWQKCQKHTMSSVITVCITLVASQTSPPAELTFINRCRPRPANHRERRGGEETVPQARLTIPSRPQRRQRGRIHTKVSGYPSRARNSW